MGNLIKGPVVGVLSLFVIFQCAWAGDRDWQDCIADHPGRAIAACSRIISESSEPPYQLAIAYNNRGLAYRASGEILRAFADYGEALRLNPTYARALYNRALAHLEAKSLVRALDDLDAALLIQPSYAKALATRGILFAEHYNVEEALPDFEKAFRLERDLFLPEKKELAGAIAEFVTSVAVAKDKKISPGQQLAGLTAAIKLGIDTTDLRNVRAELLLEQGEYASAIADLDIAIEAHPNNARFLASRCQAYTGVGNLTKAAADCEQAVRFGPKYGFAYTSRGMLYLKQNRLGDAERDLSTAVKLSPDELGNLVLRGQVYETSGQMNKATADFRAALAIEPRSARDAQDREIARLWLNGRGAAMSSRDAQPPSAKPQIQEAQTRSEAGALLKPGLAFRDCEKCPEMVLVPSGEFLMGSPSSEAKPDDGESPQHSVKFERSFAVGKYEVTVAQFEAFARGTGYRVGERCSLWTGREWKELSGSFREVGFPHTDRHPAVCVNWNDAKAYVAWLGNSTGKAYRLLSEAEWEYAARARTITQYYFGNDADKLCEFANVADRTAKEKYQQWKVANCADGFVNAAPVGSFKPNSFALFDMHGNVSEWVEDCFQLDYRAASNDGSPTSSSNCALRVLRGGSWIGHPKALRAASRLRKPPEDRYSNIGFRVARSLEPDELGSTRTARPSQ